MGHLRLTIGKHDWASPQSKANLYITIFGGHGHLVEGDDDQQVEARGSQGGEQPRLGEEEGLGAVVAGEAGECPVEERDPEEDDGH